MPAVVQGDRVHYPGGSVALTDLVRLDERWDPWRGAGVLVLTTAQASVEVPLDEGYGTLRAELRRAVPRLPFRASWSSGFPVAPGGLAEGKAWVAASALTLWAGASGGWVDGRLGVASAVVVAGLAARRLARARLARLGVEVGGRRIPWQEVEQVAVRVHGDWAALWILAHDEVLETTLPTSLLPAFRARLRRLGALEIEDWPEDDELRYRRRWSWAGLWPWSGAAAGAALGMLWGGPWPVVGGAGVGGLVGGLWAAAVTWRAEGWWAGSVWAMVALYGLGLLLMAAW